MIIYKITNRVNNKVYIGVTTKTLGERWEGHMTRLRNYQRHGTDAFHLYLAMDKYGKENFVMEEIDSAESLQEMYQKEKEYVAIYDSYKSGYNSTEGGDEDPMRSQKTYLKHGEAMRSHEVREKISKSMKELREREGFSKETRERISAGVKRSYQEGKHPPSVITREMIDLATKAKQKKVIVTIGDSHKEFDSIKQSCIYLHQYHFNKSITVKTLQGEATKSIREQKPYKDVMWKLL